MQFALLHRCSRATLHLHLKINSTRSYLIQRCKPLFIATRTLSPYHRVLLKNMTHQPQESTQSSHNSNVEKMQQIVHSDFGNGWDRCWEEGLTPWDLGKPTPLLLHLRETGSLPTGRALVPGCGSGYDVVAIACSERYVVGVDISESAIAKATKLSSASPNAEHFTFLKADFFTWNPSELFDLIFDYTFFCAIEPDMRSAWASRIQDLLKPDGELITLMYPIEDREGGPPYKVSVSDYEDVLHPVGFRATSVFENELAIAPRKGREKVGRWKRFGHHSL